MRCALESHSDTELTDIGPFKSAFAALSEKLRPQVYEFGFLPA